jgi:type 1 fimbria pilin
MGIKRLFRILLVIVVAFFSIPTMASYARDPAVLALDPASMLISGNVVDSACVASTPSSGSYTVTVCFTSPSSGIALTGDTPVSISISVSGKNPGVQHVTYYLNSGYLLLATPRLRQGRHSS